MFFLTKTPRTARPPQTRSRDANPPRLADVQMLGHSCHLAQDVGLPCRDRSSRDERLFWAVRAF